VGTGVFIEGRPECALYRIHPLLPDAPILRNDRTTEIMEAFIQASLVPQSDLCRQRLKAHKTLLVHRFGQRLLDALAWQGFIGWSGRNLERSPPLAHNLIAKIAVTALQWRNASIA